MLIQQERTQGKHHDPTERKTSGGHRKNALFHFQENFTIFYTQTMRLH
jgi:hypothetical protein